MKRNEAIGTLCDRLCLDVIGVVGHQLVMFVIVAKRCVEGL